MNNINLESLSNEERKAYNRLVDWHTNIYFPGMFIGTASYMWGIATIPLAVLQRDYQKSDFSCNMFLSGIGLAIIYKGLDAIISRLNDENGLMAKLAENKK